MNAIRNAGRRSFHVVVKRALTLAEIVNLYNRINSAGVPVRKEERAFAAMVSFEPSTPDWLAECFQIAHPHADADNRNTVLKRQRERLFGFPLFIAAYTQTVGYHRDLKGDLNLLAREDPDLSWAGDTAAAAAMLDDSKHCIATSACVLREQLGCDDLRFLPSADPLRLVFALLLKYPNAGNACAATALLLGQINRMTQTAKSSRIEEAICNSNHLWEAMSAFPTVPEMLGGAEQFTRRLMDVQSMNDPWVSLLYWYQSSRGADDYAPTGDPPWKPRYVPLDRNAAAQKEHIIPFSLLYRAYDLHPRGHSARHVVNAIGNLTMISADLNYSHGADPIDLNVVDQDRLVAHHLDSEAVLEAYTAAVEVISRSADLRDPRIRDPYEVFRATPDRSPGARYARMARCRPRASP